MHDEREAEETFNAEQARENFDEARSEEREAVSLSLLTAFRAAFRTDATQVTPTTLRTIGASYQSCVERRVESHLDMTPPLRKLRAAMDAFVAVFPETEETLFGPSECPF